MQWIAHQILNLGVVRLSPSWGTLPSTATPKLTPGRDKGSAVLLAVGSMSEWLRSQTWNLMGSARVGSNPAAVVFLILTLLLPSNLPVSWPSVRSTLGNLAKWLRCLPSKWVDFVRRGLNPLGVVLTLHHPPHHHHSKKLEISKRRISASETKNDKLRF